MRNELDVNEAPIAEPSQQLERPSLAWTALRIGPAIAIVVLLSLAMNPQNTRLAYYVYCYQLGYGQAHYAIDIPGNYRVLPVPNGFSGIWRAWDRKLILREESHCIDGQLDGERRTYLADGTLSAVDIFSQGVWNLNVYTSNGGPKPQSQCEMKGVLRHGAWRRWDGRGRLRGVSHYQEGRLVSQIPLLDDPAPVGVNGLWVTYQYNTRQVCREQYYINGRPTPTFRAWHRNGQLRGFHYVPSGEAFAIWRCWRKEGTFFKAWAIRSSKWNTWLKYRRAVSDSDKKDGSEVPRFDRIGVGNLSGRIYPMLRLEEMQAHFDACNEDLSLATFKH